MKKNVLITWISSWIWFYLADNFKSNFNIYWVSRNNPYIDWVNFYSLDLSDFNSLNQYIEYIKNIEFDSIILNAWVWYFDKFSNLKEEEIINTINVNIVSPMLLLNWILPYLSTKTKVIFIGSVAWKKFFKYWTVYQASKFALRGFAWSLRNEINNKIHLINPQFVDTWFFKNERIEIDWNFNETKIDIILETVSNILDWKETRFEIDL